MTFRRHLERWEILLSPTRELDFQGFPSLRNATRGFDNFEKSCSRIGQSMISQGPRCPRSCPVSFRKAFRELWEHFAIKFDGQIAKVRSDAASRRLNRAPRSLKIELSRRREHDFQRSTSSEKGSLEGGGLGAGPRFPGPPEA